MNDEKVKIKKKILSKIGEFIANHCVSWVIEIAVLLVIANAAIGELRKTAKQTREMIARYDAAISDYASQKTKALDDAISEGVNPFPEQTEKAKAFFDKFKKEKK